jgi:hypothetical protein
MVMLATRFAVRVIVVVQGSKLAPRRAWPCRLLRALLPMAFAEGQPVTRGVRVECDTRVVTGPRLELTPGVGLILSADARYRLHSDSGAIVLVVEAERLESNEQGRSTPERIMGET